MIPSPLQIKAALVAGAAMLITVLGLLVWGLYWRGEAREAALRAAVAQLAEGRPVDVTPIAAAADAVGEIGNWRYLYFTRRGARLIYVFDVPLDVEDYEDVYRGFVEAWTGTIEFDRKVGQWNRLFRLPHVLRDDVRSETAATFDFIERPGVVVEAMNAPRVKQKGFDRVSAPKLDRTQPIAEDAMEIVWEGGEPFKRLTTLGKTYKPFFYGKDCFGALFEAKPLAGQGARHTTLLAVVGLAVGKLSRVPGTTAEAIYGLLYPAVSTFEPDAANPDWTVTLWDQICTFWPREMAKMANEKSEQAQVALLKENLAVRVARVVKTWSDNPAVTSAKTDGELITAVGRMLIASTRSGSYYVLNLDGYYDSVPVVSTQLYTRIRELGVDSLVELKVPKSDGRGVRDITTSELLNRYSVTVNDVEGRVGVQGSHIVGMGLGGKPSLILRLYQRNPRCKPVHDKQVETWLKKFAGTPLVYNRLCEWIGWALAFEHGPICALSIVGPAGIGKKLLVQGLAEAIDSECYADSSELAGTFQPTLLKTPFIVVDEGFATPTFGRDVADAFRQLVGGNSIYVNQKYREPVRVTNPARIIITANNSHAVEMLAGSRDLSVHDREALGQRLLHFELPRDAAEYLEKHGGLAFTAQPTRRWIRGDDGAPSDYVVANHFLWLHENRKERSGRRLLVEGERDSEIVRSFASQTGSSPAVCETAIAIIEAMKQGAKTPNGFCVGRNVVYISPSAIAERYRKLYNVEKITLRICQKVLRSWQADGDLMDKSRTPVDRDGRTHPRGRYAAVAMAFLIDQAERLGLACPHLRELEAEDRDTCLQNA